MKTARANAESVNRLKTWNHDVLWNPNPGVAPKHTYPAYIVHIFTKVLEPKWHRKNQVRAFSWPSETFERFIIVELDMVMPVGGEANGGQWKAHWLSIACWHWIVFRKTCWLGPMLNTTLLNTPSMNTTMPFQSLNFVNYGQQKLRPLQGNEMCYLFMTIIRMKKCDTWLRWTLTYNKPLESLTVECSLFFWKIYVVSNASRSDV